MRKKILIVIAVALISVVVAATVVNQPSREPWSILFKQKVELFIVHYEDGVEIRVPPSTPEGEKLMSACQDALDDSYQIIPSCSPQCQAEIIAEMTENHRYVIAMLENECNINIQLIDATTSRILFVPVRFKDSTLGVPIVIDPKGFPKYFLGTFRPRSYHELVDIMEQLRH